MGLVAAKVQLGKYPYALCQDVRGNHNHKEWHKRWKGWEPKNNDCQLCKKHPEGLGQ